MKRLLITLILLWQTFSGTAADAPASEDQKNIQGTWLVESASEDGRAVKDIFDTVVFAGDQLTLSDKTGKEKKDAFRLDPGASPKVLHFPAQHPSNVLPVHWAYELNGDTLKLVNTAPNHPPTEISDKRQLLIVLKRKAP
jgi:uncharacterized protein (TIGR03067 family)